MIFHQRHLQLQLIFLGIFHYLPSLLNKMNDDIPSEEKATEAYYSKQ